MDAGKGARVGGVGGGWRTGEKARGEDREGEDREGEDTGNLMDLRKASADSACRFKADNALHTAAVQQRGMASLR